MTTSLQVAESFEKKHQHVLRDIDALKKMCPILDRCFLKVMNQIHTAEIDEFSSLVEMVFLVGYGFYRKESFYFKQKYIEAFNEMEDVIRKILFLKQLKI